MWPQLSSPFEHFFVFPSLHRLSPGKYGGSILQVILCVRFHGLVGRTQYNPLLVRSRPVNGNRWAAFVIEIISSPQQRLTAASIQIFRPKQGGVSATWMQGEQSTFSYHTSSAGPGASFRRVMGAVGPQKDTVGMPNNRPK